MYHILDLCLSAPNNKKIFLKDINEIKAEKGRFLDWTQLENKRRELEEAGYYGDKPQTVEVPQNKPQTQNTKIIRNRNLLIGLMLDMFRNYNQVLEYVGKERNENLTQENIITYIQV